MQISLTSLILFAAIVLLACTILKRVSFKIGIPALLAFIVLGMLFGSDGIFNIPFDDYHFAEYISTIALVFIMFYGGFGTSWKAAKPVAAVSLILSSLGTIATALLVGLFCHFLLGMSVLEGLLCGALLSSTDAASVFSILRSRNLALKENTDSLLEVESGSNDPFAYMLTIVLLTAMEAGISVGEVGVLLLKQLALGLLFGFGLGYLAKRVLARVNFDSSETEMIFVVAVALFGYGIPLALDGNGFLSVYIVGILLGNSDLPDKPTLVPFFDGLTGIMQATLFFMLGLLAFPSQMLDVLAPALAIALFLTLVARPLATFILMAPFHGSLAQKLLVSFAGLRGAASVVFAIVAVIYPVTFENDLFHIVFVVVLFSIAIQGSLLPFVAKKLKMIDEGGNVFKTFTDYVDETPVNFIQFEITPEHAWVGQCVRDITLPPGSILVTLRRGEEEMVPKGDTKLEPGDILVLCALEEGGTPDITLVERVIEPEDFVPNMTLADLPHRSHSLIVLIQRDGQYIIPDGSTVLKQGDKLLINYTGDALHAWNLYKAHQKATH